MAEFSEKSEQSQRREVLQKEAAERFVHLTTRTDWKELTSELFRRVVHDVRFAVALITKHHSTFMSSLEIRVNSAYSNPEVPEFIRRRFRPRHYDRIFASTAGMQREGPFDLYKIVSPKLGLPSNCLVYRISHATRKDLNTLLIFGGERLEGQMEERLSMVTEIIEALQTGEGNEEEHEAVMQEELDTSREEELLARLRLMNPKTVKDAPMSDISAVVNGLEGIIEEQSPQLKSKYKLLCDYLISRRMN